MPPFFLVFEGEEEEDVTTGCCFLVITLSEGIESFLGVGVIVGGFVVFGEAILVCVGGIVVVVVVVLVVGGGIGLDATITSDGATKSLKLPTNF